MKPIHKFNNGRGTTLCHTCNTIITEGLTNDLYCKKHLPKIKFTIKPKENTNVIAAGHGAC